MTMPFQQMQGGGQPAPQQQQGGFQQLPVPQQQQQMQIPQQQVHQPGQQGFQPFQPQQQTMPPTQVQQISDPSATWAPPPMPVQQQVPQQQMVIGPNGQPVPFQPQPNQPNLTWQQQAQVTPPNQSFAPAPPQQQQQQPQQGAQIVMDRQGRLAGPGVPRELQGRTLNEALSMYNIVRDGYAQTQLMQPQQAQQQQQQGAPPAQQVNAQGQPANFWADPVGTIKQVVQEQMAPMTQQSQQAAVVNARNQVAQAYPQFAQVEGEVIESLRGLDMNTLSNPRSWETAMAAVVGRKALQGQQVPQGGQQQQQQNFQPGFQQAPQQNFNPQQTQQPQQQHQAPQQYQPYQPPPIGSFFTEQPTMSQSNMGVAPQLSPQQQLAARKFGLTDQQYLQGMGVST